MSTPRLDLETLRQVLDRIDEAVIYTDPDFLIVEWSPAAERMYGYSRQDAVGKRFTDLVETRYDDTDYETVLAEFRAEGHWHGETMQLVPGGRELRVLASVTLLTRADGSPSGVVAINREITESARKDAALLESELRFRQFAENSRDVFWMSDLREPAMLFVSDAYERVWGRSRASLYEDPKSFADAVHPEDRARVDAAMQRQLEGDVTSEEYRVVQRDGSVRWVHDRGFPVRDASGNIQRVAGIARDITELRQQERKRQELEARVQQTQRLESLGVLAGGIAHDFNNLLMAILGNIDLALTKVDDATVQRYLQQATQSTQAAAELTKQLVLYAGGRATSSDANWNSVITDMDVMLGKTCGEGVELQSKLASGLESVPLDDKQARLILLNLVTNAAEADEGGAGTISVETRMECLESEEIARFRPDLSGRRRSFVCLVVSDEGCGIAESELTRIFDPFYSSKFLGRGLGLASVYGIVRDAGGWVTVVSRPEQGSTFTVYLPASASVAPCDDPSVDDRRPLALLADDDVVVRQVLLRLLAELGYAGQAARDGSELLQLYRTHPEAVDVVLLDVNMPVMGGVEALVQLRSVNKDLPVLLYTGGAGESVDEALRADPRCRELRKPFTLAQLKAALESLKDPSFEGRDVG